jgi:hypothetical protein
LIIDHHNQPIQAPHEPSKRFNFLGTLHCIREQVWEHPCERDRTAEVYLVYEEDVLIWQTCREEPVQRAIERCWERWYQKELELNREEGEEEEISPLHEGQTESDIDKEFDSQR